MAKEPKELYNGFLFLRTGDKVDSPLVAYTLNLESVNIDCLEEEFEEKIEALKNSKDVTIKLVCNKAEVVSPERIIEYACGKQKQPEIVACGNCKRYIRHDKRCGYWNHGVKPTMWCSQAERSLIGERNGKST